MESKNWFDSHLWGWNSFQIIISSFVDVLLYLSRPLLLGKRPYNSTLTLRVGCSGSLRVKWYTKGRVGGWGPNIWWKLNGPFPYWNVYFTASMFPRQCVTLYQVVGSALLLLTGHNKHERVSTVLGLLIVTFIVMAIGICLPHGSRHININKMRHGKGNPPGKFLPLCVTLCPIYFVFCCCSILITL